MTRRSTTGGALAAAVLVMSTLPSATPAAHADPVTCRPAAGPVDTSVLIVGDSVAQGSIDDWTWRYRLWQHLTTSGASVDFVGPRDDLYDRQTDQLGSHDYADPSFDQDHAALWGMSFAIQEHPIGDLVEACRPDVVIEALGFDDLTWLGVPSPLVTDEARTFVHDARAADPALDVVLVELPQTWFSGVDAYNESLPGLAAELDTAQSHVVVAKTGTGFTQGVDTYDPAHLSATGEVKLAAGTADALATIGVGVPYPRPLPHVDNGPTRTATLSAIARDGRVRLSWTTPPGATGEYVWMRDVTRGEKWRRLPSQVRTPTTTSTVQGLRNYDTYRFRLQATKGTTTAVHLFSNTVQARPHKPAPGTVSLTLSPGRHRLTARWTAATRATSYVVTWQRRDTTGSPGRRRTTSRSLRIDHLVTGKPYRVTVTALNDRTRGPTAIRYGRPR